MSPCPSGPLQLFYQPLHLRSKVSHSKPCILHYHSVFLPLLAMYPPRLQNIFRRTISFGAQEGHQQLPFYQELPSKNETLSAPILPNLGTAGRMDTALLRTLIKNGPRPARL